MYHWFVARKVRATFAKISSGDWEPMIAGMAPHFSYRFYGDSALSGERHTVEALRRWWERSFRLLPNPAFQVDEVIVAGGPWATRIATRVRVHASLPDGSAYDNVFMQQLRMRWARITEIHTLEDTAVLQQTLDRLAESGVAEARAEPITDPGPAARALRQQQAAVAEFVPAARERTASSQDCSTKGWLGETVAPEFPEDESILMRHHRPRLAGRHSRVSNARQGPGTRRQRRRSERRVQ